MSNQKGFSAQAGFTPIIVIGIIAVIVIVLAGVAAFMMTKPSTNPSPTNLSATEPPTLTTSESTLETIIKSTVPTQWSVPASAMETYKSQQIAGVYIETQTNETNETLEEILAGNNDTLTNFGWKYNTAMSDSDVAYYENNAKVLIVRKANSYRVFVSQ